MQHRHRHHRLLCMMSLTEAWALAFPEDMHRMRLGTAAAAPLTVALTIHFPLCISTRPMLHNYLHRLHRYMWYCQCKASPEVKELSLTEASALACPEDTHCMQLGTAAVAPPIAVLTIHCTLCTSTRSMLHNYLHRLHRYMWYCQCKAGLVVMELGLEPGCRSNTHRSNL